MSFIAKMMFEAVGDLPVDVLAQKSFSNYNSPQKTTDPSYRMLGIGTDLNSPPPLDDIPGRISRNPRGVDSKFREKCEALALTGLVEGGVDLIAPLEILKQVFSTPYSLYSPVFITIRLVENTLVLSPGPGFDAQDQNSQPLDELFSNFYMHSVPEPSGDLEKGVTNEFSRVVDCKFGEFCMRLGSDMVLFRNEKDEAVSLYLWDHLQVKPLTRLEAWLDNVMANVPELAGCYHQAGFVKGYELTKTEDIYQPYGLAGDAPPAFDPSLVQQNAHDVLKFLLSHCKEDPGVYWLYKSAGEHVIRLFNLSKKHSISKTALSPLNISSGRRDLGTLLSRVWLSSLVGRNDRTKWASFPSKCWNILEESDFLVVDAHEQFARLILNEEEFADQRSEALISLGFNLIEDSSVSGGPVCQAAARSRISLKEGAVNHVCQAIKSLMQLQSSKQSSEQEGEDDKRMLRLILLLAEAYLSVGGAYIESGQLPQALNSVKVACSIYGSIPRNLWETWFESALHKTFAQQLETNTLGKLLSKLVGVSVYYEENPGHISLTKLPSRYLFWATSWLMVGDIYLNIHVLYPGTSTDKLRKDYEVVKGKELAPSEVSEAVEKFTALGEKCASCSLASCSCAAKDRRGNKKSRPGKDKVGGIYKYLNLAMKDGADSNLLAAIDCFEETQRLLQDLLPSGCVGINNVTTRKAYAWYIIGCIRVMNTMSVEVHALLIGNIPDTNTGVEEAELAFDKSCLAFKESGDLNTTALMHCHIGNVREGQARKIMQKIGSAASKTAQKQSKTAQKQYVEAAKREYIAAVKFYKEAVQCVNLATNEGIVVAENIKVDVYMRLADAYVLLGRFLNKGNTSAHGLKSVSDSTLLSAREAVEAGIALYLSLDCKKEAAYAHSDLAVCYEYEAERARSLPEADQLALLADKHWKESMEFYSPANQPSVFMLILLKRSALSLSLERLKSISAITADTSRLFEARHMSELHISELSQQVSKNFLKQLRLNLKSIVFSKRNSGDAQAKQLSDLYLKALNSTSLSDLTEMYEMWISLVDGVSFSFVSSIIKLSIIFMKCMRSGHQAVLAIYPSNPSMRSPSSFVSLSFSTDAQVKSKTN